MSTFRPTRIEVDYDATVRRYHALVLRGEVLLYRATRAKREAALHAARSYVAYQLGEEPPDA